MSLYNLIEYSDIYSDTSASLWRFINNGGNPDDVTTNNSSFFKYKSSVLGKPNNNGVLKQSTNSCSIDISKKF